ncbi:MAG: energy transducer TonB [Rhodospirillaceae bacterium]|nr:energy transducer TonB [Rhodospirillales bacterium]
MGAGPVAKMAEVQDYSAMVWGRIMRFKPDRARYPGKVTVRFTIAGDGSLVSADISEPSGIPALDQLALDVVRRAAPFPSPPAEVDTPVAFNIPFQFR